MVGDRVRFNRSFRRDGRELNGATGVVMHVSKDGGFVRWLPDDLDLRPDHKQPGEDLATWGSDASDLDLETRREYAVAWH